MKFWHALFISCMTAGFVEVTQRFESGSLIQLISWVVLGILSAGVWYVAEKIMAWSEK